MGKKYEERKDAMDPTWLDMTDAEIAAARAQRKRSKEMFDEAFKKLEQDKHGNVIGKKRGST